MTTLQYSSEGLKGCLQWIIDNIGEVKQDCHDMQDTVKECEIGVDMCKVKVENCEISVVKMESAVTNNSKNIATNADDIALLKKICKELESKSILDEEKISENHINVENLHMNVSL